VRKRAPEFQSIGGARMAYKLEIRKKAAFLHAIVTGVNSREAVINYMAELRCECQALGCSRILIEERLEGPRLDVMDVYQIVSEGSLRGLGSFSAIAYVDVNALGDLMHFAEDTAVNRGLPMRVFQTVREAEAWLADEKPGK
jgi:hypothetical protein